MLLEMVYPVSSTSMPIIPETRRKPKLIWFDTGLVNYQAGIRQEIIGSTEMVDAWRGHIAEQVTAQELLSLDDRVGQHRVFWAKPNNGAEVDYVINHASKLYPIEVKAATTLTYALCKYLWIAPILIWLYAYGRAHTLLIK